MQGEGYIQIDSRRHGLGAFLRRKQWWSFEGLDPEQGLYFVFLAMQAFPTDYVALTVLDYAHASRDEGGKNARRWAEEHLGGFRAAPGERVDVVADGKWGQLRFQGQAEEEWQVDVQTASITAHLVQTAQTPLHRNRLLTRDIDYTILQSVLNETRGSLRLDGQDYQFEGYGYCEHNWGVQPRHSTAQWLHFWAPDMAGVVMDCHYDAGVPHHYTYLWYDERGTYLTSPAHFGFDPERPDSLWRVASSDLDLMVIPLHIHRNRLRLPPVLTYIDIDYYELLVEVQGWAMVMGEFVEIRGVGKYDHNFNWW